MSDKVGEETLRAYLDVVYGMSGGGFPLPSIASVTDDFDEYVALCRITTPLITHQTAAEQSGRPDFVAAAALYPDVYNEPFIYPGYFRLANKKSLDLATAAIPDSTISLILQKCQNITSWRELQNLPYLRYLVVYSCQSDEMFSGQLAIDHLDINDCDGAIADMLCMACDPVDFRISQHQPTTLSGRSIRHFTRTKKLAMIAPNIRDLAVLSDLPIEDALMLQVQDSSEINTLMTGWASTLQKLSLACIEPLSPDNLQVPPRISRLRVPGHLEYRNAWIEWAVQHPDVACDFASPENYVLPVPVAVAEIYKGIAILKTTKKKTIPFFIETDFADILGIPLSNGDLEDIFSPLAKKEGKHLSWSSEADTFVAYSKDIETCRWIVDTAYDYDFSHL